MHVKMRLWTLLLFLIAPVSRGNLSSGRPGECQRPELKNKVHLSESAMLINNFFDKMQITLECSRGYVVDYGSNSITCLNGTWTEVELNCKKRDCGLPLASPHVRYNISEGTLFGAYIRPYCERGYSYEGSSRRQCLAHGWGGMSKCLVVTCGMPPEIAHSVMDGELTKGNLRFEDVIEYSCEDGYTLVGNRVVVCQKNGRYSALPECKAVTCGEPPEIPHSFINSNLTKRILEVEDVIEFRCEENYTLLGNKLVFCQKNGQYSSLPQCKGDCTEPDLKGNVVLSESSILRSKFPDESKVALECARGHEMDYGSTSITCLNGEWSEVELNCKKVTCGKPPESPHLIVINLPNDTLKYEDVIEFHCEDGYTLEGNRSVVCQANGQYSSLPECKEVTCGKPPESPHLIVINLPNDTLKYEHVIEFHCEDGYTLEGNRSVVCQANGQYSSLPECKEMMQKKRSRSVVILSVGIIVSVLLFILILSACVVFCRKPKGSYDTKEGNKIKMPLVGESYTIKGDHSELP